MGVVGGVGLLGDLHDRVGVYTPATTYHAPTVGREVGTGDAAGAVTGMGTSRVANGLCPGKDSPTTYTVGSTPTVSNPPGAAVP